MDNKKIFIVKVEDLNIPELKDVDIRTLKPDQLISLIESDLSNFPGSVKVELKDDFAIITFTPEQLSPEDELKFKQAVNILLERNLKEGQEILLDLVSDYPRHPEILYNLGISYSELGDFQSSLKPLHRAIELIPYYADALTALGYSYSSLKDFDKAMSYTLEALKYQPKHFYALRNLSTLYARQSDYAKAVEQMNKALELQPDDPSALYGMALIYKDLNNYNDAKVTLKKIIDNGVDGKFISLAKDLLRSLTVSDFKSKGVRMDAVMYLVAAISEFSKMPIEQVTDITFTISTIGQNGFKVETPDQLYTIPQLNKKCSGLQMVCYMYAGFKIIEPKMNIGFDLSKEYDLAQKMRQNEPS